MELTQLLYGLGAIAYSLACPDLRAGQPLSETLAALPGLPTPVSVFYNATQLPNEQKSNVTKFLNQALALSTSWQIHQYFQDQRITQQLFPALFTQPAGFVIPFSPFDDLFFVGQDFVSFWAYNTGDGLVVTDALDFADEIQEVMLPALSKFGFSGADVKHVIITHEHLDHTAEQKVLRFGKTWFQVVLTPGHTPGCLSLIFPLTAKNGTERQVAGLNGGTSIPRSPSDKAARVRSHYKLADAAKARGVDTLISNHQIADHALFNSDLLKHAEVNSANPFMIGKKDYYNYLQILALCTKVQAARLRHPGMK
ncbi:hypothetical protein BDZ85DRAFT_302606 [Elsinoe ampelina]|uniref:Metallo-beta-lactamase domain-containing protein n=1 Tax=Elsinoe ampelina TaxID=302913 RepID=A0A6A6G6N2_9PEZI|nr:hypothetical protein BDZ85DRAFT_302606 [Elsinoe ampelina]